MNFIPPSEEDFIPVSTRAICPICQKKMIHTRIEVTSEYVFHVWMCDCEPQPDDIHEQVEAGRQMSDDKSMVCFMESLYA